MTNAMVTNEMAFNSDELLREEQLDSVVGGISAEAIVDIVKQAIAIGAAGAESIQKFVDSQEYDRMSNSQREKALGKSLANNPAFCGIVLATTTSIGLTAMQIKFRTVGVSSKTRELIEQRIKSK